MATCDSVGSTSLYQESEESFTYECDVCKQENQTHQATVYCPKCEEHLCNSCESWHKKLKATRFHDAVPVTDTAGKEKPKSHALSRTLMNECGCNTKREAVFFCLDHHELICSTCKNAKHRKCKSETTDDIISKRSVSEEFKSLTIKNISLIGDALKLKEDHAECLKRINEQQKDFKKQIHQQRVVLDQWLDKIEERTQSEMEYCVDGVTCVLEEQSVVITDTLQLLDEAKQSIETTKALESEKQMFVIKKLQHPFELYEKTLSEFKRNITRCIVTFEQDKEIIDLQQRLERFGYFHTEGPIENAIRKNNLRAQAKLLSTITLRLPNSKGDSRMLAFACASNGEILIADSNNMLIHLGANLKIRHSITATTDSNSSLAHLDEEVFVVTTDWRRKISYVTIIPTLLISHSVNLETTYEAMAAANRCIYLLTRSSSNYPPGLNLLVLDKLGNLIKTLSSSEMPLESASYLALNPTGSKFFVAGKSTVTCMTTSGRKVYSYKHSDMKSPKGIVVDEDDNALVVCESKSNKMHVIISDGTRHKILLSGQYGIRYPRCIGYRVTDGLLFVGQSDKVHVFKMR